MSAWEGRFSWQEYALSGRPDFLNYLNTGDVTWEALWQFYRQQPAPVEAVRALVRLFHLFLSCRYDEAGCWLDPEGEIHARLRAWADFALDPGSSGGLDGIQNDLAGMVGAGMVTALYYQAAYTVFAEASVDRLAQEWSAEHAPTGDLRVGEESERLDGFLPLYHPGSTHFPHLREDPAWRARLRAHLVDVHTAWNIACVGHLPDFEEEEAWTTVGGEA